MTPDMLFATLLMALGIVLVVLEIHLPTHGLLGIAGVSNVTLSAFLLLAPASTSAPVVSALAANGLLLTVASSMLGALGLTAAWAGFRARRLPVVDPLVRLPGARGVATSAVAPVGTVMVRHQHWSAVTEGGPIKSGEAVEVVAREGLRLRVRRMSVIRIDNCEALSAQGEVRPGIWVERTR